MGLQAGVIFIGMCVALYIGICTDITDFTMIALGNGAFFVGGIATVFWWTRESATVFRFTASVVIVSFSYPLLGPCNRSKFTRAIHDRPELAGSIGLLQSLFQQAFSIGGFVSPIFVTHFVMKDPQDIDSTEGRELTPWAWYVSVSSLLVILGLIYEEFILGKNELGRIKTEEEESKVGEIAVGETTRLLADKRISCRRRSTIVEINQSLSRQYEVDRQYSAEANGIPNPSETPYERKLRNHLLEDRREWEKLLKLDQEIDEMEMME